MSGFKKVGGNDFPTVSPGDITDSDPMIVRVPMDNVEWGSRKGTIAKVRSGDGFKENRMTIKHSGGKKD